AFVNAKTVADGKRPISQTVPVNDYPVAITVEQKMFCLPIVSFESNGASCFCSKKRSISTT
ncbi:MAG: hypothetical protein WBN03_21185, partial [Desulfobacterales bacterium]